MSPESYIQFSKGLDKAVCNTFRELIRESAAHEQTLIAEHLETNRKGQFEEERIGTEIKLIYPKLFSKRSLIKYAILSWYIPEWSRFELQEIIRDKAIRFHFPELESYLQSKDMMIVSLYLEIDLTHGDLFGNLLTKGVYINIKTSEGKILRVKVPDRCYLVPSYRKRPKRKVRRRGYKDHGSRPTPSESAQKEANTLTGLEQFEIELRRSQERLTASTRILKLRTWISQNLQGV